jgi:hypothetical protein
MTVTKQELEHLIAETHQHGVELSAKIHAEEGELRGLEDLNAQRRRELAEMETTHPFEMYDTTDVNTVPDNPAAVAGYIDGKYQSFDGLAAKFPKAKKLSIAVFPENNAGCLDIETGDATPGQAPAWVRRQHARGDGKPVLYADLSTMPSVLAALAQDHIQRSEYKLWVADWTGSPHIPAGFDACQYTDTALGRNLDASSCHSWFL